MVTPALWQEQGALGAEGAEWVEAGRGLHLGASLCMTREPAHGHSRDRGQVPSRLTVLSPVSL